MLRRLVVVPAIVVLSALFVMRTTLNDIVKWVRDHV